MTISVLSGALMGGVVAALGWAFGMMIAMERAKTMAALAAIGVASALTLVGVFAAVLIITGLLRYKFVKYLKQNIKGEIKMANLKGKYCIVRGDRSGVFAGIVQSQEGREVTITDCRNLWAWEGACAINQLALDGTTRPDNCRFTVVNQEVILLDVIEIIPCSEKAEQSIRGVAAWKK